MDKKTTEIATWIVSAAVVFGARTLDMIPDDLFLALLVAFVWYILSFFGWPAFTQNRRVRCLGYIIVAVVFVGARLIWNGRTEAQQQPIESYQHNEGDSNTNIQASGPIMVYESDLPALGNMRQRAVELAEEIFTDLHRHGYSDPRWEKPDPPKAIELMPGPKSEYHDWLRKRQLKFEHSYLPSARILRDEFAELHLRNRDLDDSLRGFDPNRVTEHQIADVAFDLKQLSDQLPESP